LFVRGQTHRLHNDPIRQLGECDPVLAIERRKDETALEFDIGRQRVELAVIDEDPGHFLPQFAAGIDDGADRVGPAPGTQRAGTERRVGGVAGLNQHIGDRDAEGLSDHLGEGRLMAGALRRVAFQNLDPPSGVDADCG
jgi:hypothetical protein